MTEEEQKAIKKLEIEGTENNYLEVKIVLDLVDKQQETLRKQSYTNKKLRNKIKTVRKERNKLQKDIEIKDKVIEKAFKYIDEHTYRDMEECEFGETNNLTCIKDCDTCIKQYFYKQVEKVEEEKC